MQILIIRMLLKKKRKKMRQSPPRAAAGPCLACSDSTAGCPLHQPTQSTQPPLQDTPPSALCLPATICCRCKTSPTPHTACKPPAWLCALPAHLQGPRTQWDAVGQEERSRTGAGVILPVHSPVPLEQHLAVESGCSAPRDIPFHLTQRPFLHHTHTRSAPSLLLWSAPALLEQNRL